MKQTVKGINLLPKQYVREQQIRKYKYIAGCILAVECVIFISVIAIPPKVKIQKQQVELDALQTQLNDPKYEGVNKAISDLQKARDDLKVWTEKYSTLKSPNFISARVLDSITSRVPSGVTINGLTLVPTENTTGGVVSVEGTGTDYGSVFSYVTVLENTYGSENVSFTVNRQQQTQGQESVSYIQYTITVNEIGENLVPDESASANEAQQATAEESGSEDVEDGGQTS